MSDKTTREQIVEAADQLFYRKGFEHTSFSDIANAVNDDPFVRENVVSAEILEISPSKTDERLSFLLD